MGKGAKVNTKELEKFIKKLEKTQKEMDDFCIFLTKSLAKTFLTKVKKKTPVQNAPKIGGTLRKGWNIAEVKGSGGRYKVDIFNNTEYAVYVEYGHRQTPGIFVPIIGKTLKKGWVEGRFFMTKTEIEMSENLEQLVSRKVKKLFKEKMK